MYCLVKDNQVIQNPRTLPNNAMGISNLAALSDAELKQLGYLPCIFPERVFDSATQNQLPDTYIIEDDSVTIVYNVEDKSQEELDIIAAEAERIAAKAQAYIDNLPSWEQVETNISNINSLADAKIFLAKLALVVYWDIKDTRE